MKPAPILSICIPTFQRKESLKRTLQKLIESEKLVPGKIEICISDNASNDGTFEMLEGYTKKYSFIHIRKNSKNLGFDSNLVESFKMARGEYCWGTGDDDPIIPGGVLTFVMALSKGGTFIMGLSGVEINKEYFPKQEYSHKEFINCFISMVQKFKYTQDSNFLGGMSCYFFSNNVLKKSFKSLEGKRYGWYHLALLFYVLSNFEGLVFINKKSPVEFGEVGRNKKIYLPSEEFNLFVDKRIKSLSNLKINARLRNFFYSWLNARGNYIYIKSLIQLTMFSEAIDKTRYDLLRNRVYECEKKIRMPVLVSFVTMLFRILEGFAPFRKTISFCYRKIRPNYSKLMHNYLKGLLQTNEEREGNTSVLKE